MCKGALVASISVVSVGGPGTSAPAVAALGACVIALAGWANTSGLRLPGRLRLQVARSATFQQRQRRAKDRTTGQIEVSCDRRAGQAMTAGGRPIDGVRK